MQKVNIKLNGMPVIEAEFKLLQGVESSKGYAVIEKSFAPDSRDSVNLSFGDGSTVVELSNLKIKEIKTFESANDNQLAKVELGDSRLDWQDAKISGRFNVTEDDGEKFVSETLNSGAEYTLKDLLELCFAEVGADVDCSLSTLNDVKPKNIRWSNTKIVDALNDLLALGDVDVSCATDCKHKILPRTASESVVYNNNIVSAEIVDAVNSEYIPGKIKLVGGKTWVEKELTGSWEPVCPSDGTNGKNAGEVYSLSAIAADWGLSISEIKRYCLFNGGFSDIPGSADQIRERRQILQRCAYKWYRYNGAGNKFPWLSHRAETDSSGKPLPIKVKHTFFRLKNEGSQAFVDPYENVTTPTESSFSYEIDCEKGIVKFREVQGILSPVTGDVHDTRLEGRSLSDGAEIVATVAWELENTDSDGQFEYTKIIDANRKRVFTIRRDDFRLRKVDSGVSVSDLNRSNLETASSQLIDEIAGRFKRVIVQKIKYAGCYTCNVSGVVKALKYKGSAEDGLTSEVEMFNIPSLPGDVIIEKPTSKVVSSDSVGDERSLKQVNAYSVGPVVIKADDAVLAESMSFIKASGTPGNIKLKELGVMRNPFFWERENDVGGWITLSLASVIIENHPVYTVKESDEAGQIASGSKGIDVSLLEDTKLEEDDLVIVFETHNGHKVALPLMKSLVCDHSHADEAQENLSTEVSDGNEDDEKIGDLDDILWIKRDQGNVDRLMLNINPDIPQAFYTGDGANDAVAILGGKKGVLIAPRDCELHKIGENKDKQPVIEGHVTTEANFYQDRIGDGPIDFVQSIRVMGDDPLGKYHKADMWWDYDQKKWIPWYQLLWQKIPPVTPTPTYPPTPPPNAPPVQQPVDGGTVIGPFPVCIDEKPIASEDDRNFLGLSELPWCGLVLGEYSETEALPGIVLKGGDSVLIFKLPRGKTSAKVEFDENIIVEFKDDVKIDKDLDVEGKVTGGNASDSWLRIDGQNSPAANIDWGGKQITNICHIQQKDNCKHYFGDENDAAIGFDTVADCLKFEGKDICVDYKVKTQDKFCVGGNDGISGTMTLDDGVNFRVELTFNGGILTAQNVGATSGTAESNFE